MNYKALDAFLREYTHDEIKYINYSNTIQGPKELFNQKEIYNKNIYKVLDRKLPKYENITISRHPRFIYNKKHIHDFIEITYVYSGQCTQIIENKKVELFEGDICIMDKDFIHQLQTTYENDIIINIIIRNSNLYSALIENLPSNSIVASFIENILNVNRNHDNYIIFKNNIYNDKLKSLILNMFCEYWGEKFHSNQLIKLYLQIIFSELIINFDYETNYNNINESKYFPTIEILHYISNNITTCSLDEVAFKFNYHPNYLTAALKKSTNKSFKELVMEQRMNKAVDLLLHTNMSISQICNTIGYANSNFFYKKFQKIHHTTPKEFRISHLL